MTAAVPFELAIERHIDASPEIVFKVWTERLEEWWAPKPWTTRIIEHDPNQRIVFTNAFTAGWIPQTPFMVGLFEFAPEGGGTRYRASARHWDEATMKQHEAMGFQRGWTQVAEQLAALAEAEHTSPR